MAAPNVTIAGTEPEAVLSVDWSDSISGMGDVLVEIGDTAFNRQFGSGDRITVDDGSGPPWTGYVVGKPVVESEGVLEIEGLDDTYELKLGTMDRVFFDVDRGEAVRRAVTQRTSSAGTSALHTGSTTTPWDSDAPEFELCGFTSENIQERGDDLVFAGAREGQSAPFYAEVSPADVAPADGGLLRLTTRLLVNDPPNQISGTITYDDGGDGPAYEWTNDFRGAAFETLELRAEDAEPVPSQNGPVLRYEFRPGGGLSDNVGVAIDYATATFFRTENRDNSIGVSRVQDGTRNIVRRYSGTVMQFVEDMAAEEAYSVTAEGGELVFGPSGAGSPELSIVRGSTPVVSADFNTDYGSVTNQVVVTGDEDNDVSVTVTDDQSVDFYGLSARSEPLVNENIKTVQEAQDLGESYLQKNAWNDTVATFEVAGREYGSATAGAPVSVDWPTRDLSGVFAVRTAQANPSGVSEVELGVRV